MKLKVKPSARLNRRYLLVEANNKEDVEKAILDYIGILGYAKAAPLFVDSGNSSKKGTLILAINRKEINNIRAAFEISRRARTLKVSGTLKSLKG